MSEGGNGKPIDKSESSSFEDLVSAAAQELEEAKAAYDASRENQPKVSEDGDKADWTDVLGSGAILKKVLTHGAEEEGLRPQRGDLCTVSYEVRVRGEDYLVEHGDRVQLYLGDNETLQGIDLALALMYKGEVDLLRIDPRFGYGERGLKAGDSLWTVADPEGKYDGPAISGDSWLETKVELHEWIEEPEHESLTIAQRMELGARRRRRGNVWYERGEWQLAVQTYRRALDALDETRGGISEPTADGDAAPVPDDLHALLEERIRVQNNMAAAQMKAGAFPAALQAVSAVLACEPQNAKALYRKSRILSAMGRAEEALAACREAARLAPVDPAPRRELAKAEQKVQRDRSAERKLARRMLGTGSGARGPSQDPDKKPNRTKVLVWGGLLISLLVGVASVIVYRYRQNH